MILSLSNYDCVSSASLSDLCDSAVTLFRKT